jgi:hypothetical protein
MGTGLDQAGSPFLIPRGTADFDDPAAYRAFTDQIVSRRNARDAKRIDHERATLQALPDRPTSDHEEVIVRVTSSGGFTFKVFYTVPSRLIGHQLRVRLYDDRPDVFVGVTHLVTVPRGRAACDAHTRREQLVEVTAPAAGRPFQESRGPDHFRMRSTALPGRSAKKLPQTKTRI